MSENRSSASTSGRVGSTATATTGGTTSSGGPSDQNSGSTDSSAVEVLGGAVEKELLRQGSSTGGTTTSRGNNKGGVSSSSSSDHANGVKSGSNSASSSSTSANRSSRPVSTSATKQKGAGSDVLHGENENKSEKAMRASSAGGNVVVLHQQGKNTNNINKSTSSIEEITEGSSSRAVSSTAVDGTKPVTSGEVPADAATSRNMSYAALYGGAATLKDALLSQQALTLRQEKERRERVNKDNEGVVGTTTSSASNSSSSEMEHEAVQPLRPKEHIPRLSTELPPEFDGDWKKWREKEAAAERLAAEQVEIAKREREINIAMGSQALARAARLNQASSNRQGGEQDGVLDHEDGTGTSPEKKQKITNSMLTNAYIMARLAAKAKRPKSSPSTKGGGTSGSGTTTDGAAAGSRTASKAAAAQGGAAGPRGESRKTSRSKSKGSASAGGGAG
ncbi:unnamed protein product, partial [Amoebophrya sp. A120]|eukprot:GSA120T00016262001.1